MSKISLDRGILTSSRFESVVHTGRVLSDAFSPDDSGWATVGQQVPVIPPSDYGTLIARHQCSLSSGGLHQEVLVVHTRAGALRVAWSPGGNLLVSGSKA